MQPVPFIAGVAENQLTQDGTSKGNGRNILLRTRAGVGIPIDLTEHSRHGTNDLLEVSTGKGQWQKTQLRC